MAHAPLDGLAGQTVAALFRGAAVGADPIPVVVREGSGLMDSRHSLAERAQLPEILLPEDLAVVLGLSSARAAKEFVTTNGVPHVRMGQRVYVLSEALITFLRDNEERHPSKEERRAKADEIVSQIAPTARQRRHRRKPPSMPRRRGED